MPKVYAIHARDRPEIQMAFLGELAAETGANDGGNWGSSVKM